MKSEMPGPIGDVPCQCVGHPIATAEGCICGPVERFLRAGGPFTAAQREWCAGEIEAIEGHTRPDLQSIRDADLGNEVLDAWQDFCRDKGLL